MYHQRYKSASYHEAILEIYNYVGRKFMADMILDNHEMHAKYGVHEWVAKKLKDKDYATLNKFLAFRLDFIEEEFTETLNAFANRDAEEVVDGLIDIIVIALGTLDAFDVDTAEAWNQVHRANMSKEVGKKPGRPNPLGVPDLVKPAEWVGPSHKNNTGILDEVLKKGM